MTYLNAIDVLPGPLLEILQEYAAGSMVYIPNKKGLRREWGGGTGVKNMLAERNAQIVSDHRLGLTVREIAARYHLAESTVKKIIYRRQGMP